MCYAQVAPVAQQPHINNTILTQKISTFGLSTLALAKSWLRTCVASKTVKLKGNPTKTFAKMLRL